MKYYIQETEFDEWRNKTAGSKAREDINAIAENIGFIPIRTQYNHKIRKEKGPIIALLRLTRDWKKSLTKIGKGDTVLIQFPCNHHPLRIAQEIKAISKRGGKTIALVHDIDSLRMNSGGALYHRFLYSKTRYEDNRILKACDVIIVHNNQMLKAAAGMGIPESKLLTLGIFDYLADFDVRNKSMDKNSPIIIAGTLRRKKAGYVYDLPTVINFNLYGVGYENEEKCNIKYQGAFQPNKLLGVLDGSFGLVWDGNVCDTCSGISGEYLKINNPHKTSLYLAAGIPVFVWKNAAIADFVIKKGVGIAIEKISDIDSIRKSLSEKEYFRLVENAKQLSLNIQNGSYTKEAINRALDIINYSG